MENRSSPPIGSKGTILSLMIQELCLDARKTECTNRKVSTPQISFQNDAVSLSCGTFFMAGRPKFRRSKQSELLLDPNSTKSSSKAAYVQNQINSAVLGVIASKPLKGNEHMEAVPALNSGRYITVKHTNNRIVRSTSSLKKTTSFEDEKYSSSLNGDMPLEKKNKHYRKNSETLIPIFSTKMDPKALQTSQATSEQECKRTSQSMLSASISEKFLTPMVKMVDMGCYSKGDMSMRSLAAAYWIGSHHQTSAQQNHKSQERSVSFVKLQHHPSNNHFPC